MCESHHAALKSSRVDQGDPQVLFSTLHKRQNAVTRVRLPVSGFHEVQAVDPTEEDHWIGLEISAEKLYQLLVCGAMRVADFRCLDHAAKCCVRALCLHACAHGLNGSVSTVGAGPYRRTNWQS